MVQDFTRLRPVTFFDVFPPGAENARHTPMADPYDESLRQKFVSAAREMGLSFHERGTVITIEGPRFSTRAESHMFRFHRLRLLEDRRGPGRLE